jgi:hypothetical protein
VTAHPDYDITVLLRKTPEAFTSTYPNVKIVKGDYDSAATLAEQAEKADVVVRTYTFCFVQYHLHERRKDLGPFRLI